MRILHISSARTFGSGERHLVDLSNELVRRGHEVFVAVRPTSEWQHKLSFIPATNFLQTSIRNSFGMFSSRSMARFIVKNQIDIVHAHRGRDYLAASVASRSAGDVRLVLTRHAPEPLKPFHRFALGNVDAAIGVTPAIQQNLEKIFPLSKVSLIRNGISLEATGDTDVLGREFRSFHGIAEDLPLVAAAGELKLDRGQRDLVLAANEVAKHFPDCHFVIAGDDVSIDKHFRRELRRLVRVFGLENKFTWLDALEDPSPLIAAADIYVSPSHTDGADPLILDAMAARKAVVACESEGTLQLINDPRALAPVRDPIALGAAISLCLASEAVRSDLGESMRCAVLSGFGLDTMVDATEHLYQKVLKR